MGHMEFGISDLAFRTKDRYGTDVYSYKRWDIFIHSDSIGFSAYLNAGGDYKGFSLGSTRLYGDRKEAVVFACKEIDLFHRTHLALS